MCVAACDFIMDKKLQQNADVKLYVKLCKLATGFGKHASASVRRYISEPYAVFQMTQALQMWNSVLEHDERCGRPSTWNFGIATVGGRSVRLLALLVCPTRVSADNPNVERKMQRVAAKFVPYLLTHDHKEHTAVCTISLSHQSFPSFSSTTRSSFCARTTCQI